MSVTKNKWDFAITISMTQEKNIETAKTMKAGGYGINGFIVGSDQCMDTVIAGGGERGLLNK